MIAANKRKQIDVGRLELTRSDGTRGVRMFANIASFGVSGVVDRLVNESGKKLGRLSFALATARATWSYKNQRVQLVFDDDVARRVEATINTVAVANGKYFGGAMMVAPNAELDDGRFDVVAMGDFGFGDLLKSGRRLYKGTHLRWTRSRRGARAWSTRSRSIRWRIVELDVDGEPLGRLPARFELVPARAVDGRAASHGAARGPRRSRRELCSARSPRACRRRIRSRRRRSSPAAT